MRRLRPQWSYVCWLGLHHWRLYSLAELVWPGETYRERCRRCRKIRTRVA